MPPPETVIFPPFIIVTAPASESSRTGLAAAVLLLLVLATALPVSVRHKTVTYDEPFHLRYGLQILGGDASRFDDSKMPISALNALAVRGAASADELTLDDYQRARRVTMAASVLLALVVFVWARALFGWSGGLLSLALVVLDPNLQGHARFVTTDLWAALASTVVLALLWGYRRRGGWGRALLFVIALAVAQWCKFVMIWLYPICFALLLLSGRGERRPRARELAPWVALAAVHLAVLNAGYLFEGFGSRLADYDFESAAFAGLQARAGWLAQIPLPLARPYVEGLDWVRWYEVTGMGRGWTYLFGEARPSPFPGYFFFCYLLKTPLSTIVLSIAAVALTVRRRAGLGWASGEAILLLTLGFWLLYFIFVVKAQMGIRMMLMVYPLQHVLCGSLAAVAAAVPQARLALGALLAGLVLSVGSYFPHLASFHNVLTWDRKLAYRRLADSNLEWGQNEEYVRRYVEAHPRTLVNPPHPVTGRVLVSANYLTGVRRQAGRFAWYAWLREQRPIGHVAHGYLIFEIEEEGGASQRTINSGAAAGRR